MHSHLIRLSQAIAASILATVLIVISLLPLRAHELTPAVGDISFAPGTVILDLELNLEAALARIGPEHDDTDDSPQAAEYDALRALSSEELGARFAEEMQGFLGDIELTSDQGPVTMDLGPVVIPETGDVELARTSTVTLSGALPEGAETVTFAWSEDLGPLVIRSGEEGDPDAYTAFLNAGDVSDAISVSGPTKQSLWSVFVNYIGIGFEHILPLGLDHILFVVGLFLLSTRLKPLLWQITAFTLAHTVTLALGMLGIVNLPGSIVEPLIAASIVYVAVENILMPNMTPWRPVVVFIFGLLHGLGFAGVLTEFGIPSGQFVPALIGFNIGVELGQLTVIALCFLAVGLWFGKKDWYRSRVVIPGSIIVALIGAYWFIERTLL